jgi:hypothetical protein
MADGDKNLEKPKKKGRSLIFKIWVGLFLFCAVSIILSLFTGGNCGDIDICLGFFIFWSSFYFFIFGSITLVIISLFIKILLRIKNRWIQILILLIFISLLALLINWRLK